MIHKHTTFVEKDIRGINSLLYKQAREVDAFLSHLSGAISTFPNFYDYFSVTKEMTRIPHLSNVEVMKMLGLNRSFKEGEIFLKSSMASHRTEGVISDAGRGLYDISLTFAFFEKERREAFYGFELIFERSGSSYYDSAYMIDAFEVFQRLAKRMKS